MWPFKSGSRALTVATRVEPSIVERDSGPHNMANAAYSIQDLEAMFDIFGLVPTASGERVDSHSAMRVAAVSACVQLIAGIISTLPLSVYRNTPEGREKTDHDLTWLLNEQPTPLCSAAVFWDMMLSDKLLRGDGIAMIMRNAAAQITEIIPIPRRNVHVLRKGGRLVYAIWDEDTAQALGLDQDDVLHFPGFGFDGICGKSVIAYSARESIGNAIAMDTYSGAFFKNGANASVTIESPGRMDDEQVDRFRTLWAKYNAGAKNSGNPLLLTEGLKANVLSVSAQDSQLMDARSYTVRDIARAFLIQPFMIGESEKNSSWGSGIESLLIAFVQMTLQPHLHAIQQEINRKCFATSRYFVEFNVDGLLRGDSQSQAAFLREALGGSQGPGWMTQNEVRRLKNLPPLPGGDSLFTPPQNTKGNANAAT